MSIYVKNNGAEIAETNYFDTESASRGALYLSLNAGALRLLVPPALEKDIKEMKTGREVIVTWGKLSGHDAVELMFEDDSDSPYALHIGINQTDRIPEGEDFGKGFQFLLYTRNGLELKLPARIRRGSELPYMQPWEK